MKRLVVLLGALSLLTAACGSATPSTKGAAKGSLEKGVYEVGVDIDPGVYTSADLTCVALAAKTAAFDLEDNDGPDDFLRSTSRVGNLLRISVGQGEFLHVERCASLQREDGSRPPTPDPATRAGACAILVGPDKLAEHVLAEGQLGQADGQELSARRYLLQEKLMAVVTAHTAQLWKPAGELVDFLDNVSAFVRHGTMEPRITQQMTKIHSVCGNS